MHYLRSVADVAAMRPGLKAGSRVVIIGGGYIGLETAATARKLGCTVTVLEMADRVMNRVVASSVSEYFAHEHRTQGIKIVCNTRVVRLEGTQRVERVVCADGSTYEADLLVVGVGAVPNFELAAEAGLSCENGITVDEHCRTSDAAIYAAGDCTNHPSPRFGMRVRLESVDNAFEQAKTAALNLLGRPTVHDRVPWFWSDQFDNKLLIVGLSSGLRSAGAAGRPRGAQLQHLLPEGRRAARRGGDQPPEGLRRRAQADRRARPPGSRQARRPAEIVEGCRVMPLIVFIERGGARREVGAPAGVTVMEVARQHGIDGIVAQCGGACACATCHVYVAPRWLEQARAARGHGGGDARERLGAARQ